MTCWRNHDYCCCARLIRCSPVYLRQKRRGCRRRFARDPGFLCDLLRPHRSCYRDRLHLRRRYAQSYQSGCSNWDRTAGCRQHYRPVGQAVDGRLPAGWQANHRASCLQTCPRLRGPGTVRLPDVQGCAAIDHRLRLPVVARGDYPLRFLRMAIARGGCQLRRDRRL